MNFEVKTLSSLGTRNAAASLVAFGAGQSRPRAAVWPGRDCFDPDRGRPLWLHEPGHWAEGILNLFPFPELV
jgi:hypothetical protein